MRINEEKLVQGGRKPAKIGPGDSSDTISDRPGEPDSDTDAAATGERATAGLDPSSELHTETGVDRIVDAADAGLGGGLDEAEEAQLGITDEEIAAEEAEEVPGVPRKRKP